MHIFPKDFSFPSPRLDAILKVKNLGFPNIHLYMDAYLSFPFHRLVSIPNVRSSGKIIGVMLFVRVFVFLLLNWLP